MFFVVVDFEMNNYKSDNRWLSEIIQIGAVRCTENFEILDQFNEYIKNGSKVNGYIKQITGIDESRLQAAQKFQSSVKRFSEWQTFRGEPVKFVTWGSQDRTIFLRQMSREGIDRNIQKIFATSEWVNIQKSVSKELTILKNIMSLSDAVQALGMQFSGVEHDALCDAIMTARVLRFRNSPEYRNYSLAGNKDILISQLLYKLEGLKEQKERQLKELNELLNRRESLKKDNGFGVLTDVDYIDCPEASGKYAEYCRLIRKIDKRHTQISKTDNSMKSCIKQLTDLGYFNKA